MSRKRRSFTPEFKAKVAMEAIKETRTLAEIASQYDVLPVQVSQWKAQLLEQLPEAFKSGKSARKPTDDFERERNALYRKIGQLEVEREFLKKKSEELGLPTTMPPFYD